MRTPLRLVSGLRSASALRGITAVFFALAFALPAIGQGPEDILRDFKRYFRTVKTDEDRVEAVRTLEDAESPAAVKELIKLLSHKVPEIAKSAQRVLAGYEEEATFAKAIEGLVDMKDGPAKARLIRALGDGSHKQAEPAMIEVLADTKSDEVQFAALRSLARIGSAESVGPAVAVAIESGSSLVRAAAADTAGDLRVEDVGESLIPLLEDSAWQVQSAAARALGKIRVETAIDPLIDRMEEGGRIEVECADALFEITGTDLGIEVEAWRRRIAAWRKIDGWRIPTDGELDKARASREKNALLYAAREGAATFGGIPTTSTAVIFIIDVSGSMDDVVVERERFESGYEDFRKLTIVKTELARTIDSLDENTHFNIVSFATDTDSWKRGVVPANVINRASAKDWVAKLEPIGGSEAQELAGAGLGGSANLKAGKTNTFKALMSAFGIDPEARKAPDVLELAEENRIDTVFFLSDGRPSTGKLTDTQLIVDEVLRLNDSFGIVFHTISIGQFQSGFLKSLADGTSGVFVDLGR
ncbi:MAG: HEAT repeat domain-containing protein [Planctomycetota bacterium]